MIGYKACPNCKHEMRSMALFCPKCGTAVMPSIDNVLLISLQQTLDSMKPGQSEVLRRCAIPRWIDLDILAVLRDRPNDEANQRILKQLAGYSFVRDLGSGRYTYTEDVRTLLLNDWRSRPHDLRPIQKRLYRYFEDKMNHTALGNRATWLREIATYDLMLASTTLAQDKVSDEPMLLLPSTIDARIDRALLRYRSLVESALQGFRLAETEALLIAAEEQSSILAPKILRWLLYYRACLNHVNLNFAAAITVLEDLLVEDDSIDRELQTLTIIRLGDVLVENSAWSRAIRCYRQALEIDNLQPEQRAAIHLGIGDAYNEMAINAGGWHIPPISKSRFLGFFLNVFQSVMLLPTWIIVWILRRLGTVVPPTPVLISYQNWVLARIFRASREEVEIARQIYAARADYTHVTRCDMRLIESDVLFGLHTQAVQRAKDVLSRKDGLDGYRRARVELTYAHALFASGQHAEARALAQYTLVIFRRLKDIRWETRALNILGRIALAESESNTAIDTFTEALDHARQSGSVLSRERTLYELRSWRRAHSSYPKVFDTLINQEPVQRFVSRFPRFLLPIAQIVQMIVIPAFLIMASIIVPQVTQSDLLLTLTDNSVITGPEILTFPLNRVIVTGILGLVLVATTYILIGIAVLWRMPIVQLQDNQPEIVEVTPTEVIKYNALGVMEPPVSLQYLQSITTTDRTLWNKILHLFSATYLKDEHDRELRIDGITSWYNSAVDLIKQRAEQLQAAFIVRDLDTVLVKSWIGIVLAYGVFSLVFFVASGNKWFFDAADFFAPNMYAILQQVGYSGLLIIIPFLYWILYHPLIVAAKIGRQPRRPLVIAAMVFGLSLIVVSLWTTIIDITIFRITLLFTGIVLLLEGLYLWWEGLLKKRVWSFGLRLVELVLVCLGLLWLWPDIKLEFLRSRSYAYSIQGNDTAAANDTIEVYQQEQINQSSGASNPLNPRPTHPPKEVQDLTEEYYQDQLDAYRDGEIALTNEQLGIMYHNLASAQINVCKEKANPRSQSCRESYEDIIKNEEAALNLIEDRRIRSLIYENLGWVYQQVGDCTYARERYQEALQDANKQDRRQHILEHIEQLDC